VFYSDFFDMPYVYKKNNKSTEIDFQVQDFPNPLIFNHSFLPVASEALETW